MVLKERMLFIRHEQCKAFVDLYLYLVGKLLILTLERRVSIKVHELILQIGKKFFKTIEPLYVLASFQIFFALYKELAQIGCRYQGFC